MRVRVGCCFSRNVSGHFFHCIAGFIMARSQQVVVKSGNSAALTLGIIATVIGAIALLVGWIPFLGLLSIPFAVIGGLLAVGGVIASAFTGFRGILMPVLGCAVCVGAVGLSVASTGATSAVITEAAEQVQVEVAARQQQREADAASYAGKIDVYEVEAKYMNAVLDGRVPGILFKLRNNGDRTLTRVQVTVYFKDATGAVIAEEDFNPVLVTSFSTRNNKPLKPGYVWQMDANRFMSAKSVPSEWAEGSVDLEITDIAFEADSPTP